MVEENISECPESESVELNAGPQPPKRRKETKITNFFTSRNATQTLKPANSVSIYVISTIDESQANVSTFDGNLVGKRLSHDEKYDALDVGNLVGKRLSHDEKYDALDVGNLVGKRLSHDEKYDALMRVTVPRETHKFPVLSKYPGAYSISQDGAYCIYCVLFVGNPSEHLVLVSKSFKDWKHATERFNGHFLNIKCDSKASFGYETHKMCAESALSLQRVLIYQQAGLKISGVLWEDDQAPSDCCGGFLECSGKMVKPQDFWHALGRWPGPGLWISGVLWEDGQAPSDSYGGLLACSMKMVTPHQTAVEDFWLALGR
ncbi:hypothetical protein EMCRGX_G029299 [Ephydatia muelleri]